MHERHSLSLTLKSNSALLKESNCEARSFFLMKNNYAVLKISNVGKAQSKDSDEEQLRRAEEIKCAEDTVFP